MTEDLQRKREQLDYRRRIAILTADLHKAEKEQQSLAMEMLRLMRKRAQIDEEISDMKDQVKKIDNDVRVFGNELKTTQKRLNRIS